MTLQSTDIDLRLRYYSVLASKISEDINKITQDHQYELDGGRIERAIDFTEIYSYVFQSSEHFLSKNASVLFEDNSGVAILYELHEAIMREFLFSKKTGKNLVLFDPYKVELRNFAEALQRDEFRKITSIAPGRFDDLKKRDGYGALEALVEKVRAGATLEERDIERIERFVQEHVPSLLQSVLSNVRVRLNEVFKDGNVTIPTNVRMLVGEGDIETYNRWFEALNVIRPDKIPNNSIDAKVISIIFALNKHYLDRGKRIRYVLTTRSEIMNTIAASDSEAPHWRDIGGNPIRHPRGALAMLDVDGEIIPLGHSRLNIVLARWAPMWRTGGLGDVKTAKPANLTDAEFKNRSFVVLKERHLNVLKQSWSNYIGTKVSRYVLERNKDKNPVKMLLTLTNEEEYRQHVIKSLDDTFDEITTSSIMLQFLSQSEIGSIQTDFSVPTQERPRSTIKKDTGSAKPHEVWLRSVFGPKLYFSAYCTFTRYYNGAREFGHDPLSFAAALSSDELTPNKLHLHDEALQQLVKDEWHLLIAYVGAAIGAWKFSTRISEWRVGDATKIKWAKIDPARRNVLTELMLLQARCLRHFDTTAPNLRTAYDLVEQASKVTSKDPLIRERFFAEKLKLKLLILDAEGDLISTKRVDSPFSPDNIFSELQSHIEKCRKAACWEALCQNYNNKIYHCLVMRKYFSSIYSRDNAMRDIEDFKKLLSHVFSENADFWPDNFADSISYALLQIAIEAFESGETVMTAAEFDAEVLSPLERISKRTELSTTDRSDFRAHAREALNFREKVWS